MSTEIAISLDNELLAKLDKLVKREVFPSLDVAIQSAIKEKLARLENNHFAEALETLQKHLQVDANKAAKWMATVREGRR
ncbi:MAG: ribbon-helix-helix domain-containing protein [Verrucomicrobiota bacterium]